MTQKYKIAVLKPIDLVVLHPKKGEKKIQLNRTIIEVTLIKAGKPIDLVVYNIRIVYNFCRSHTGLLKPHSSMTL